MTTNHRPAGQGKCPFSGFDHHALSVAESHRVFEQMHESRCPVIHSEAHGGFFVLASYGDVRAAGLDWKKMSSAGGVLLPRMAEGISVLETDPPEHVEWRALLQKIFLPKALNAHRPKLEAIANQLIDRFAEKGACDLVSEYAELLPIMGFFSLIDFEMDSKEILKWGSDLTSAMQDPARYTEVFSRLVPLALGELRKRRDNPGEDFLSVCATTTINGKPIGDGEFVKLLAGLITAGHESTATAIASLLFNVLSRPEIRAQIGTDPKMEAAAIEETLRLATPFLSFFRRSTETQTVGGIEIPAGAPVMLSYAGANRDPAEFEKPAEFRLDRPRNHHVTFGYGPHVCAGAPLARMEMRIALSALLRRLPQIELGGQLESTVYGGVFVKSLRLPATFPA